MKQLYVKKPQRVSQSEFENFIAFDENNTLKMDTSIEKPYHEEDTQSVTNLHTPKKFVYEFKDNVDEPDSVISESLHELERKDHPEIDLPYRVIGIAYTSKGQKFTSVYKKWTHCDIKDTSSYCYLNK